MLDVLMRTYPGIFSFLQTLDEDYLAGKLGMTVPRLRQALYSLSLEHVISYVPADHSDVVFLHHDRLRPGNVDLMPERYRMLRDNFRSRSEAMLEYASETSECRSRYLLRYFGQTDTTDCGTCDICRSSAGAASSGGSTASLRSAPPLASLRSAPVPPSAEPFFPLKSPKGHLPLRGAPRVAWVEPARLAAAGAAVELRPYSAAAKRGWTRPGSSCWPALKAEPPELAEVGRLPENSQMSQR